ncbi:MetQ/NlpA family ABC transporter substrate-binding protein [Enterococcus sp. LJL99]
MQNKVKIFLFIIVSVVLVTACGKNKEATKSDSNDKSNQVIKVAAHLPTMVDVIEIAAAEAKKDGYNVELVQVNDNIQYNELLKAKEVDANFAQHEPFMQKFNEERNADLVIAQKIYNAKVGFYSKHYKNLAEIPDGATVALPSDVSNEGRALAILADEGLIKLKDGSGFEGTTKDIVENPKNLNWLSVDLLNLAEAYNESDVALAYNYPAYIAKVGLKPKDALLLEKTIDDRFAISLVAREDNLDSDQIKELKKVMTSDKVRDYLVNEHSDTLVPAF